MSFEPSKKRTRDGSTETEPETPPAFATSTATTIEIDTLALENRELKGTVTNLSNQVNHLTSENRIMKEKILDLQCRSMRNNLIFSGIPLPISTPDDPEKAVKEFMQSSLKIPPETVNRITFHRVHRLTSKDKKSHLL
ncbi:hypothetical protein M9458_056467 [Cirrhinus mrigala]|uniref:Uncharacterized protein n=1 Tax=Cirrhinus mrigala TaxID=683832 RepID=A0ABD0MD86_CIRMR